MPNHVTTRCVIAGPAEAIERLKAAHIRSTDEAGVEGAPHLDFETIIPQPVGLMDEPEQPAANMPRWWHWRVANWGTKWNSYHFEEVESATPGAYEFLMNTAWNFPEPIFMALAEKYPALSFTCHAFEEGCNFAMQGTIGHGAGDDAFVEMEATDELYEKVHGCPPPKFDDEELKVATEA